METPPGEPDRISISFEKSPQHFSAPVNGAWGGLTPDGQEVVAALYQERGTIPDIIEVEVEEGLADLSQGERISRGDILREVQATFVMSPEAAQRIGEWLLEKSQQAREQESSDGDR